jgi:outer membrane receptor protein involved in Fe transport
MLKVLTLVTLSYFSQAQTTGNQIIGAVNDDKGNPVQDATILLLRATDSSQVLVRKSDAKGHFELKNLIKGKYLVAITAIGYKKFTSGSIEVSQTGAVKDLPVKLTTSSKELNNVTVVASRPPVEIRADKTVVNVEASVTNVGATALEVLEKSPGITIDKDGNISLKGKQGVTIMIDGRPTYLSATDLTNYLKSLPASALDQIEIMTNPSAKYDAAGNSGIINLRTKKNKQKGFNGSLTLNYGQGSYWKTNNSLNLNYRTGKFNIFANYSYSIWNGYNQLYITRKFKDANTKQINGIFEQDSWMKFKSRNNTLKVGMDYFVNKKTTLGVVLNGYLNKEINYSESTIFLKDPNYNTDSITYSLNNIETKYKNGSVNLNMRHQFDTTGQEITADVDFANYTNKGDQYFTNNSYNPEWLLLAQQNLRAYMPVNVNIYSAKVDYTKPLKGNAKLEAGLKSSYVRTVNSANFYNIENGEEFVDNNKTNSFTYKENINAAYVNFNKKISSKFSMQAGLRYENTNNNGKQAGNNAQKDSSFTNSYHNLFPTAYLTYSINDKNDLNLNYGRRIDRPAYQDMNPFMFFLDNYTYMVGNPYLQPQYTNNIEFSHTYRKFLTTTLNYSHTKNIFAETFEQQGNATIIHRGNIGKRDNAGLAVSAQIPIAKWWTASVYANVNYNHYIGTLYNEPLDIEATNFMTNINNQFKFGKGWSAELSGFYRTKGIEGQIMLYPFGQLSTGVAKNILKDKATIKLNARDILYTQKIKGEINFQQTEATFNQHRDSRVVNLSFVWRFGKQMQNAQQNRRTGGADAESNRVKRGGGD